MKKQILLGTLLGDACIGKLQGKRKTYRIEWEHSLKQEEYALWKAKNSLNNYSIYKRSRFDSRSGNIYHSITCYSKKDDYLYYRNLFYKDKKEITEKILNKLKPLGIAVWYMDDGNLYYNGNCCHLNLAVDNFENKQLIIDWFKKKYNLNFKISQKAIRLTSVKECQKFIDIIEKYLIECMLYKTLKYQKNKYKNK